MLSAHTVEQVRAAEAELMAGLPEGALMQRAAYGLAAAIADFLGTTYGARVLLLVGSGDNGGDALFAGAHLARRGAGVEAVLLDPGRAHQDGLAALLRSGGRVVTAATAARPDVIVDGIVGIGAGGALRPAAVAALAALPAAPVVAVDVPSGVSVDDGRTAGEHVRAALTVTFGTHKVAHLVDPAAAACGAVTLVDIGLGLPRAAVTALQPADVAALLPVPGGDDHKYTRGVVGVRTGSASYPGAAVLSVAGADCGLAGMVRYVGSAGAAVLARFPEVTVGPGRVQAWVVGSGGGADAGRALAAAMSEPTPIVVDADALRHLSDPPDGQPSGPGLSESQPAGPGPSESQPSGPGLSDGHRLASGRRLVLTPHAGELARLLDVPRDEVEADPLASVRRAARETTATVLLKGRRTLVATPEGAARVNLTGTPWLATAGTGDVLAGLIGALLAAGLTPYDAASVGAWLHGAAATRASGGGPIVASGVAAALPATIRDVLRDSLGTA